MKTTVKILAIAASLALGFFGLIDLMAFVFRNDFRTACVIMVIGLPVVGIMLAFLYNGPNRLVAILSGLLILSAPIYLIDRASHLKVRTDGQDVRLVIPVPIFPDVTVASGVSVSEHVIGGFFNAAGVPMERTIYLVTGHDGKVSAYCYCTEILGGADSAIVVPLEHNGLSGIQASVSGVEKLYDYRGVQIVTTAESLMSREDEPTSISMSPCSRTQDSDASSQ